MREQPGQDKSNVESLASPLIRPCFVARRFNMAEIKSTRENILAQFQHKLK